MKIIWTRHARERLRQWNPILGITRNEVEETLRNPQEIVPGDYGVLIAQSKHGNGLLRIPFKAIDGIRKVLTLYWTSKVVKYRRARKYENKL